MRRVVTNDEVPHLWAHQAQDSARNAKGTFYFEGKVIYSYGGHFPIARFVENARGEKAVVVTTRGYSVTTGQHISRVKRAVQHIEPKFHVPLRGSCAYTFSPGDYVQSYRDHIKTATEHVAKCRAQHRRDWALDAMQSLVNEANAFCRFFDLPDRFEAPGDFEEIKAALKRAAKAARDEEQRRRENFLRAYADKIAEWQAGEDAYIPPGLGPYLRVKGDEVETSLGARFPLSHALRGLALVRKVRESGEEYVRNGHTFHLGHYAVDRVSKNGDVKAGCHLVKYEEIERIAPQIEAAAGRKGRHVVD